MRYCYAAVVVAFTYFKLPQLFFSNVGNMGPPIHVLLA